MYYPYLDPSIVAYRMLGDLQNKYHTLDDEGDHFHDPLHHKHLSCKQMLQIHNYLCRGRKKKIYIYNYN